LFYIREKPLNAKDIHYIGGVSFVNQCPRDATPKTMSGLKPQISAGRPVRLF
jgi:hypothetical protein